MRVCVEVGGGGGGGLYFLEYELSRLLKLLFWRGWSGLVQTNFKSEIECRKWLKLIKNRNAGCVILVSKGW